MKRILHLSLLLTVWLGISASAHASHYLLEDVEFFSEEARTEFDRFGIEDTEGLLRNLLTPDDRSALSFATGIEESELERIALICELLQVPGIGPRAASLLQAAGVESVMDLAGREPATLLELLVDANGGGTYTSVNPELHHVEHWVGGASEAELFLVL